MEKDPSETASTPPASPSESSSTEENRSQDGSVLSSPMEMKAEEGAILSPSIVFSSLAGRGPGSSDHSVQLDEIADDLLTLLKEVRGLTSSLSGLSERLNRVEQRLHESSRQQVMEIGALRQELSGDRRHLLGRKAFDAVAPMLDVVRAAQRRQHGQDGPELISSHFRVLESALRNIVQSLGFTEFSPALGEVFDPSMMECLELVEGRQGHVMEVLRTGYRAGEVLVRPSGVRVGNSQDTAPEEGTGREH